MFLGDIFNQQTNGPVNGQHFTTFDSDNDKHGGYNCAVQYPSSWWHAHCFNTNLNGNHLTSHFRVHDGNRYYQLKSSVMKIRRAI